MSILSVVGSSRISNTIYVAVASIYWTFFLTLTGIPLNIDVDTVLLVISPSAIIASFLWAIQLEERIITKLLIFSLVRSRFGQFIRYHMGYVTIFLKLWQSSMVFRNTIRESLTLEIKRALRSRLLKDDMNELYQLLWLLISIPPVSYLLLIISNHPIEFISLLSLSLSVILIIPIYSRKREKSSQVLKLAFCNWLAESIDSDNRRRNRFEFFREISDAHNPEFRKSMYSWAQELLQYVDKGDWEGFEKNMGIFLDSLETHHHEQTIENEIDYLVGDLIWFYNLELKKDPRPSGKIIPYLRAIPTIVLLRAPEVYLDSLNEIRDFIEGSKPKGLIWGSEIREFFERWKDLESWNAIYYILTKNTVRMLSEKNVKGIARLPFLYGGDIDNYQKMCDIHHENPVERVSNLANCMMKYVDRNFIQALLCYRTVTRWGVSPKVYIASTSARIWKVMFEEYVELSSEDMHYIYEKRFDKVTKLDSKKVAANLNHYENSSHYDEILKHLKRQAQEGRPNKLQARNILLELDLWNEPE